MLCIITLITCVQAQHAQKKTETALVTLSKAIALEPRNPLCKFHKASILLACDRHKVCYFLGGCVFISCHCFSVFLVSISVIIYQNCFLSFCSLYAVRVSFLSQALRACSFISVIMCNINYMSVNNIIKTVDEWLCIGLHTEVC